MSTSTYTDYWIAVFGDRDEDQVVLEFGVVELGLDEWVGQCEAEAARQSEDPEGTIERWAPHHETAVRDLLKAVQRA